MIKDLPKLRSYPQAAPIADVIQQMHAAGFVHVMPAAQLGTTPRRAAFALRTLGFPTRERRAFFPSTRGQDTLSWTLWTSPEGAAAIAVVYEIAQQLAAPVIDSWTVGSHVWPKHRLALRQVARYYAKHRDRLAEYSSAYRLDAPAHVLESMLAPVRETLLTAP